jgi:hypothetical protein
MPAPPPYTYHRLVVGYHGCDRRIVEDVLLRGGALQPSRNRWDWLGEGVYFWEGGYQRALEFAQWKQSRGELDEPVVLGAYIHLGRCFDLTDTWATDQLGQYYARLAAELRRVGEPLPRNRRARADDHDLLLRNLDCAVLNFCLTQLAADAGEDRDYFQTVRGVFVEGEPAYPGARIHARSHVQIAVRDPACILGYFLPARGYTSSEE